MKKFFCTVIVLMGFVSDSFAQTARYIKTITITVRYADGEKKSYEFREHDNLKEVKVGIENTYCYLRTKEERISGAVGCWIFKSKERGLGAKFHEIDIPFVCNGESAIFSVGSYKVKASTKDDNNGATVEAACVARINPEAK